MYKIISSVFFIFLLASCASKTGMQSQNAQQQEPSSLNPNQATARNYGSSPKQNRSFWDFFRKKENPWGDQLVDEYEDRMKQNAKDAKKKDKEMEKPQYSDFTYFGHKKKPKKRPPHKMKFCKECGIRH